MSHTRDLDQTQSHKTLLELARNPFALNKADSLTKQRLSSLICQTDLLALHYAFEHVNEPLLQAFQELTDELKLDEQYQAMSHGEAINQVQGWTDDPVAVLHQLTRGFPEDQSVLKKERALIEGEKRRMKQFLADHPQFTTMIQIGIGGSELGPKAMFRALSAYKQPNRDLRFLSNVDPDHAIDVLQGIDWRHTLVAVVSKSGSTLETKTNEAWVRAQLETAGCNTREHIVSITTPASLLDDNNKYLTSFYMLPSVGGRFSSSSAVGELALRFALGNDVVDDFMAGAKAMDIQCRLTDVRRNPALLAALLNIWNHVYLGINNLAILPYTQALDDFVLHLQQCVMESNGKSINRVGKKLGYSTSAILWGSPGTNSQHSYFQQLHQGTTRTSTCFVGFKNPQNERASNAAHVALNNNLIAQMVALACGRKSDNPNHNFDGNRPSRLIMADRLDGRTVGALLSLFENQIAYEGFILNLNSFDQEGVQLGKKLAQALEPNQDALRAQLGPLQDVLLDAKHVFLGD